MCLELKINQDVKIILKIPIKNKLSAGNMNAQSIKSMPISVGIEYNKNDFPLVTVITVVFNGEQFLASTIQSVINQTYPNLEYIVIDGGSTDGTLNIIREYEQFIAYWVSEKDHGIYDAMNKGIDAARGEWINFMNVGDTFNGHNVFQNINTNNPNIDIYYSDTILIDDKKKQLLECNVQKKSFIHQSMIYKKNLHKNFGLYLSYPGITISDYLFFFHVWKQENSQKLTSPISCYRTDGVSSRVSHYYQKLGVDLMCIEKNQIKVGLAIIFYATKQYLKKLLNLI